MDRRQGPARFIDFSVMPLLLDLDNTLVDRDGAFANWAPNLFDDEWGGDAADVDWLVRADAHGYTPRDQLARMLIERFNLAASSRDNLVDQLLYEHVDYIDLYPGVRSELVALVDMGVPLVVVTNGDSRQQRLKLERTGLVDVIRGTVISGDFEFKKPDARIFEIAKNLAGHGGTSWMVGDHVKADIAGARRTGCLTAWVSHGRQWMESWNPTLAAAEPAEVLAAVRRSIETNTAR